jgi:hypothetical protein
MADGERPNDWPHDPIPGLEALIADLQHLLGRLESQARAEAAAAGLQAHELPAAAAQLRAPRACLRALLGTERDN